MRLTLVFLLCEMLHEVVLWCHVLIICPNRCQASHFAQAVVRKLQATTRFLLSRLVKWAVVDERKLSGAI